MPPHTKHDGGGESSNAHNKRFSFTATFLICSGLVYFLVLGTQVKIMKILDTHDKLTLSSSLLQQQQHHHQHVNAVVRGRKDKLISWDKSGKPKNDKLFEEGRSISRGQQKRGSSWGVGGFAVWEDDFMQQQQQQQQLLRNGTMPQGHGSKPHYTEPPPELPQLPPPLQLPSTNTTKDTKQVVSTNTTKDNEQVSYMSTHNGKLLTIEELYKTVTLEEEQRLQLVESIAAKWNLTTPKTIELLLLQFHRVNDYNLNTDFFHFHHLYKSGGTSISNLMDRTVGLPKSPHGELYYEHILPGSYMSGNFDHDEALKDINRRLLNKVKGKGRTKREDLPYRASYAHTGLRPVYGPKRTKTGIFLLDQLPKNKRLRVITMLRDPTDFRASNHAMIMCGLNYEVTRFNNKRRDKGLKEVCSPKDGLNISALVDRKIGDLIEKCHLAKEGKLPKGKKIFPVQVQQCKQEAEGVDTLVHCRSAKNLLASNEYDKHYRSMFKGLMGRFHRGQEFTNSTAYGRMGYGFESAEKTKGYSVEAVEEYTLQDLGGLDLTISGAGDGVGPPEPDFIWFGITERMKESTILFYYYFKSKPLPKTPIHRIQDCRPNSWWTAQDRDEVKKREPADYAVWRAANAILDVRMEKMKMEVQRLLDGNETRESLFYVDWDQLDEIGVKLGR